MKRKLLNMLAATSTLTIAPVVLVSCSFNISGNTSLSKPAQIELIQKQGKTNVLNEWLLATFSTLYVDKILDPEGSFDKTKREAAIGEIANFLIYLKWSDSTTNKDATTSPLSKDQQQEVEKTVYEAYKFLVIFRSSVSTGTEDISSPADYFVKKATEWKKDQITTVDHESLIGFNPLPGILPTKPNSTDWNQDKDFQLLFKAWGTGIFSDTLKILMGQMHFLHADEKEIKNGTDYNKQTRTKFNKNWLEATSFDVKDDFYFLNKYLVTKNPQFKWEKKEETTSGYVTNINESTDFNNLMGPTKVPLDPFLTPLTSDIIELDTSGTSNKKLETLKGFTKLEYDSAITDGDLSVSMDTIKTFGFEKSGLLNTDNNNALVGFGALKAVQVAKTTNGGGTGGTTGNSKGLPSIKIKNDSLIKDVRKIQMSDLEMSFNGQTGSVDSTTGNLKLEDTTNSQSWEVVKLSFLPQETGGETEQKINLSIKYNFKDSNQKDLILPYSFDISWSRKAVSTQTTPFDEPFMFSEDKEDLNKMFPTYIKSTNEGKPDFSYILKPLPIFDTKDSQTIEIEKQAYMTGKFSLENTIWKSTKTTSKDGKTKKRDDSAKIKLVNWFILSDDSLWSQIQDFYLFNNYNIEAKNSEFSPIISELGLTKKTDKDRKDAGIIF